jgi:hypothetical protein
MPLPFSSYHLTCYYWIARKGILALQNRHIGQAYWHNWQRNSFFIKVYVAQYYTWRKKIRLSFAYTIYIYSPIYNYNLLSNLFEIFFMHNIYFYLFISIGTIPARPGNIVQCTDTGNCGYATQLRLCDYPHYRDRLCCATCRQVNSATNWPTTTNISFNFIRRRKT